ncbi:CYTH and CHAD domain-containing protein [Undibacterium terreum]|uniref:Inorganic triphosphatase n=1 Tax=Undibacterium terreum TaxID=1224302 RepID=A0A916UVJ3_9BURK|nr:CYTH and CHAD domain-containing protein [Undibacterium terreum]GGC89739.1 inorganic triphosphatase [Undibacterium terreum]
METELKLQIHPRHADAVRKHPLLKKYAVGKPQEVQIDDTYFDTPDLRFWRDKAGLRVRRARGAWVQTLKGGGTVEGGLHQRHEWESRLDTPSPDLGVLHELVDGHPRWRKLLHSKTVRQGLAPVFTARFTRSTWALQLPGGDQVEFALDQGQVLSQGRPESISEIELELKSGRPESLFEFALELQHKIPLRISNGSKAQQGYALYRQPELPPPAAVKAAAVELPADLSVQDAFALILSHCTAQIAANEAGVTAGGDIECLHQMRVGLRRLRSALGLCKEIVAVPLQVQKDIAWLAVVLGAARDSDVLAHSILPVAARAAQAAYETQLGTLRSAALSHAEQQHAAAAAAIASPRYARLMLALSARAHGVLWPVPGLLDGQAADQAVRKFAHQAMALAHRKLRKRGRYIDNEDAGTRHRVRIAAKKLRYATEFFASLYPQKRTRPYIEALARLQDGLGELNDAASAPLLLTNLQNANPELAGAAAYVSGYLASRAEYAGACLSSAWDAFAELKPLAKL